MIALSLLSGSALADSKNYPLKAPLKYMREIQNPAEDKTVTITKIAQSRFLQVLHIVTIETCAGKDKLYSPELVIKSDNDYVTVKVSGLIMPKTCKTNDFFIRANNPNSISVSFSTINPNLQRIPHTAQDMVPILNKD